MTSTFAPPPSTSPAPPATPASHPGRRILALTLPCLSTDRIARRRWGISWRSRARPEHPPVVLVARQANALRLVALDDLAQSIGLKPGLGLAEARAMRPDLDAIPADPAADQALIDALAGWADRYTPLVAHDGAQGLMLDITGCAHLFGGEKALLDDCLSRLFHLGFAAEGAIAEGAGLAWALARHRPGTIAAPGTARGLLAPLPVTALRIDRMIAEGLAKLGLRLIGDVLSTPRASLARRFGTALMQRLDEALGLNEEAISPRRSLAPVSAERRLSEPVSLSEDIVLLVQALSRSISESLERRGEGGKLFELRLYRVDGHVDHLTVGASAPVRSAARIAALFAARLDSLGDTLDAGFGYETVRLNAVTTLPLDARQSDLSGRSNGDADLAAFIDAVAARHGPGLLAVPVRFDSHWPERASGELAADPGFEPGPAEPALPLNRRPIRLFARPEPVEAIAEVPEGPPVTFRWRRAARRVRRAEGPERIAPEWWIDGESAMSRDYYAIEDETGRRWWLYREGLYERETSTPRWFMHGVFA